MRGPRTAPGSRQTARWSPSLVPEHRDSIPKGAGPGSRPAAGHHRRPACSSAVTLRRAVQGGGSWESVRRGSPSQAPEEEKKKKKGGRLLLSPIVTGSALRKPTGRNCRLRYEATYTRRRKSS